MRPRSVLLAAALCTGVVAPARAQRPEPQPEQYAAIGTYDLQVELGGQAQSSVLKLWKEKEGLTGSFTIHGQDSKVEKVAFKGSDMTVYVTMSHGALTLSLTFKTADQLTGTFSIEGMGSGNVAGVRRKS